MHISSTSHSIQFGMSKKIFSNREKARAFIEQNENVPYRLISLPQQEFAVILGKDDIEKFTEKILSISKKTKNNDQNLFDEIKDFLKTIPDYK